jgi:cytochrome c biogenesis protein CcdA
MNGIQLLNDALLTVAFTIGLAIALSVTILSSAALWRRHEQTAGVRAIERHLAAAVTADSRATSWLPE